MKWKLDEIFIGIFVSVADNTTSTVKNEICKALQTCYFR